MTMPLAYSFAFQPIVNIITGETYSYEALIRGKQQESAIKILSQITPDLQSEFDYASNTLALVLASQLGLKTHLNLNFTPTSLLNTHNIFRFIEAIKVSGLDTEQIIVELTEGNVIQDNATLLASIKIFRQEGIQIAIDDFGAGYSGLNLLVDYQPQIIKLDMNLIRNIQRLGPRQVVVKSILNVCVSLGIQIIAEGIETEDESNWLQQQGVELFQGYFFAKPGFEYFPLINKL